MYIEIGPLLTAALAIWAMAFIAAAHERAKRKE